MSEDITLPKGPKRFTTLRRALGMFAHYTHWILFFQIKSTIKQQYQTSLYPP